MKKFVVGIGLCAAVLALDAHLPQARADLLGRNRTAFVLAQEEPPKEGEPKKEEPPKKADAPPVGGEAAPKEAPKQLKITIVAIQGFAQVKQAADKPWQPAKVGMELSPGADLRTALRSVVQIKIEPGQTITLDRLGTIKIIDAVKEGNKVKTDIGMQYGRTSYTVEAEQDEHDAKLHTPGTVMAIRGTATVSQSDGLVERTTVKYGSVNNTDKTRMVTYNINARGEATVTSTDRSPTDHAMKEAENNPRGRFAGLDRTEKQVLRDDPADRGDFKATGLRDARAGGKRDEFETNLAGNFPFAPLKPMAPPILQETSIEFSLSWFGTSTDLNFSVKDPAGDVLNVNKLAVRPATSLAGSHSGNDMGSVSSGMELVFYGPNSFGGKYQLKVDFISGADVTAQINGTINDMSFATPGPFNVGPSNPQVILIADTQTRTINFPGEGGSP
ncbi:MAG: FecR domain-containing protein [Phycisphaeraceae bacterium]